MIAADGRLGGRAGSVSVLIPTYNHAAFIGETLESVLAQDHPDFEVVVGDDGSRDGTDAIVEQVAAHHPGRVCLLRSAANLGIARNFNRLLNAVSGEFFAWLGGDDLMLPGKLSRQVALMQDRPDAVGSVHDAEVFESETGRVLGRFSEVYNGRRGFREGGVELWFRPAYYTLPSTMMIRTAARPQRGYDERFAFSSEWIFDIETFRHGRCVVLDDVLCRYRRHTGNVTAGRALAEVGVEETLMIMALVQARYPELTPLVRLRKTGLLLSAALDRRSDRRAALPYFRAALQEGGPWRVGRVLLAYGGVWMGRRRLGVPPPD